MPESDKALWKLSYYHGLLPREDVITMLKNNGDFMVRKSEENAGDKRSYVLSVMYKGQPKHYLFREEKGLLAVDHKHERGYKTIKEFIETHQQNKDSVCSGSKVTLVTGIGKRGWELAHTMIEAGTKLGSGAFGIVRRGTYTAKERKHTVAIKEATLTKCTKDQIKEFMNEARLMRQFNHPNVIRFHGVAVGEEPLMIVMELATQGALKDYLQEHNRGMKSKLYMCIGAAAGLGHIHEKGIIHCDIAARNCLYSEQKVKIADFGLARELKDERSIKLDKNQRLPIKWLAPETMRERVCTKKTDVWAFGIMCWEIFENGGPPYAHIKNNNEVAKNVMAGERLKFNAAVPTEMADMITKRVWHGNSSDRYSMQQTMDWMDRNVKRLADALQTTTHPSDDRRPSAKDKSAKNKK